MTVEATLIDLRVKWTCKYIHNPLRDISVLRLIIHQLIFNKASDENGFSLCVKNF